MIINLTGNESDSDMLLTNARILARSRGWTQENVNELLKEMKSQDYAHLLNVFRREFEEMVTFDYGGEED
jgi:hypothetical protein